MRLFHAEEGTSIKGGTCGRKTGGVKGKGDNECHSETKENWIWGMSPGVRPEKGHLTPEVKAANDSTCDYVCDKLCTTPPFL
jgi:hypothetical protein